MLLAAHASLLTFSLAVQAPAAPAPAPAEPAAAAPAKPAAAAPAEAQPSAAQPAQPAAAPVAPPAAGNAEPSAAALEAFARGEKLLMDDDNTRANLEAAVAAYDDALKAGLPPQRAAVVHSQKAMAYLRLGDLEPKDDRKLDIYKKGQAEAEKGIKLDPACAECHYQRGGNLGRWGQTRGVMRSLFILGDVKGAFKTALKHNPQHIDSMLALGLVDQKVPGFAGGSGSRAEAAFRAVLKKSPNHTRAMLDLAELLEEDDREEEAATWARKALDEKSPALPGEWRKFDRARAEKFLKKLGK